MEKTILLSLHDVTPAYAAEIGHITAELDSLGITRLSLLAVPDFQRCTPLGKFPEFCRMLKARHSAGADLGLHGIHHEYAEFGFLSFEKAKARLSDARKQLEDALGISPSGFVAPQWFQSEGCKKALVELGARYSGRWRGLCGADGQYLIRAFPTNFDWGNRLFDAFFARFNPAWLLRKKTGVIRFSMHPMDVRHGRFDAEAELLRELLENGWEVRSYGDAAGGDR